MLFCAQYFIESEHLESAMAKRLEWDEVRPENMKVVCEYTVHGKPPPFTGWMIIDTDDVATLNFLVIYFGESATFDIRPCSNTLQALEMTRSALFGGNVGE